MKTAALKANTVVNCKVKFPASQELADNATINETNCRDNAKSTGERENIDIIMHKIIDNAAPVKNNCLPRLTILQCSPIPPPIAPACSVHSR